MVNQENLGPNIVPNKFHLAFALAVVKLKPPDKQLKDYILEIRHFIRNDMQTVSPDRFFDSVAFWQTAYKDSEAEQTRLLNKIFELEQRSEGLAYKTKQSQPDLNSASQSSKRKFAASLEGLESPAPAGKRVQMAGLKSKQSKEGEDDGGAETPEDQNASKLMRQIYIVQGGLRKKQNYKPLTIDAVNLCKIAEREILGAIIQLKPPERQSKPHGSQHTKRRDLGSVVKAVELSFNLAHQALHRVMGFKNDKGYKSQIIYHLVCLFESIMGALSQHCTAVSTQTDPPSTVLQETSNGNKSRMQKPRKAARGKPPMSSKVKRSNMQNDVAQQLIDLLVIMALSLDLNRSVDEEVMEGFLFIAIDRVGKILALFVFDTRKLPSNDCSDLHPPQGLMAMKEEAMTPQAVQLEAKYLISFLDRVLSGVSGSETMQSGFIRKTKERFQMTLMQAVFGTSDPLFRQGLTRPATPPPLSSGNRAPNRQDFSEWFTEELWRLVGWDVLNSVTQSS